MFLQMLESREEDFLTSYVLTLYGLIYPSPTNGLSPWPGAMNFTIQEEEFVNIIIMIQFLRKSVTYYVNFAYNFPGLSGHRSDINCKQQRQIQLLAYVLWVIHVFVCKSYMNFNRDDSYGQTSDFNNLIKTSDFDKIMLFEQHMCVFQRFFDCDTSSACLLEFCRS